MSDLYEDRATSRLGDRLELARSRLEERFVDGGNVLASALAQMGEMIAALDQVTAALDAEAVDATVRDLTDTADQLLGLPALHAARQDGLRDFALSGKTLGGHVEAMQETLRYLRTFAVTVKITGAGATEFVGFADEMLDKILMGRKQADGFAVSLTQLAEQVRAATSFGKALDAQYQGIVPRVARDLSSDAERMGAYHADVAAVARSLATLVHAVQGKVAKVLSALQIGDITRQRIEHVQIGLRLVDETRHSADFHDGHAGALMRLLAEQTEDLLDEFHGGCRAVTSSLAGLAADAKEIMALGRKARGDASAGSDGFLRALEISVGAARGLVEKVEAAGGRADAVSRTAAATAHELTEGVDGIRAIKTEIQHMAINTSLRCARMGEAGKPMNVVASELRVLAEQMETVASHILECLEQLEDRAAALLSGGAIEAPRLGETLDGALAQIRDAGGKVAGNLKQLTAQGDQVARSVSASVAKLDFTRELGDVLEECALALDTAAAGHAAVEEAEGGRDLAGVAEQLFSAYTMKREREVHRRHFPAVEMAEQEAATPTLDEDDVLF